MRLLQPKGLQMHLLLGEGGPLLDDYRRLAPVTLWPKTNPYVVGATTDKVLGKLGLWQPLRQRQLTQQQLDIRQQLGLDTIDAVLVNTVTSGRWFRQLALPESIPVITFAHELAMSVGIYTQPDDLRFLLQHTHHMLAVSQATADYYTNQHGFDPARITLFTLIDTPALQHNVEKARSEPTPLPSLGIPADAVVVGGCGLAEWRKGNDLFIILARLVVSRPTNKPVHFVWVGMKPNAYRDDLWLDVEKAGLADRVHFVEPTPEVLRYMTRFHIFALTSREDPYPLVVLEAGLSEVPVLCFDGAGGAPELIEADAGVVVPYLDIELMADSVAWLADDPVARQQKGKRLRQKVQERHPAAQSMEILLKLISEKVKERQVTN